MVKPHIRGIFVKLYGRPTLCFMSYGKYYHVSNGTFQTYLSLTVNGSLGEGLSLTVEERNKLVEAWQKASKGR